MMSGIFISNQSGFNKLTDYFKSILFIREIHISHTLVEVIAPLHIFQ